MTSSPASNLVDLVNSHNSNHNRIQVTSSPKLDSFALLTLGLAVAVGIVSWYSYKRSEQELKRTMQLLKTE